MIIHGQPRRVQVHVQGPLAGETPSPIPLACHLNAPEIADHSGPRAMSASRTQDQCALSTIRTAVLPSGDTSASRTNQPSISGGEDERTEDACRVRCPVGCLQVGWIVLVTRTVDAILSPLTAASDYALGLTISVLERFIVPGGGCQAAGTAPASPEPTRRRCRAPAHRRRASLRPRPSPARPGRPRVRPSAGMVPRGRWNASQFGQAGRGGCESLRPLELLIPGRHHEPRGAE
jgi:hypothetical protein